MRGHVTILAVVLVSVLAMSGCTSRPPGGASATADKGPYRLESEGKVPPLGPTAIRRQIDRVDTFEDLEVVEERIEVEDVAPVAEVVVQPEPADTTAMVLQGYRVQVFASGIRDNAEAVRTSVEAALNISAYVELLDGIYKVRVGDCPNRQEAETLLRRCREAGYSDAWIVSSKVTILRGKP